MKASGKTPAANLPRFHRSGIGGTRQPTALGENRQGRPDLPLIVLPQLGQPNSLTAANPHYRPPHRIAVAVLALLYLHSLELVEAKLPDPPAKNSPSHQGNRPTGKIESKHRARVLRQPP